MYVQNRAVLIYLTSCVSLASLTFISLWPITLRLSSICASLASILCLSCSITSLRLCLLAAGLLEVLSSSRGVLITKSSGLDSNRKVGLMLLD